MFPYKHIKWPAGSDNMGGLPARVYFIPAFAVLSIPPVESPTSVVRKGEIKVAEGTGFVEIYATPNTLQYKSEQVGEADCRSAKVTGEFFTPGMREELIEFSRAIQNTQGIFIIPANSEGKNIMIGTLLYPCTVKCAFDTGKKAEDRKGALITFETQSTYPVTYYEGEIPMIP